jgi:hypothetical protein
MSQKFLSAILTSFKKFLTTMMIKGMSFNPCLHPHKEVKSYFLSTIEKKEINQTETTYSTD